MAGPGALMAAEIAEQPEAWRRLLTEGRDQFTVAARPDRRVRAALRPVRRPRHQ